MGFSLANHIIRKNKTVDYRISSKFTKVHRM